MILNQASLFLIFIINGIIIGFIFDFFRILRKSFKTVDFITYIEDIIFWIITGFIILYSIFIFNKGEIRLFMFLGIILGGFIYLLLFSKYIIKVNVAIIIFFKKIILCIYKIISYPIKVVYKLLAKNIKVIGINIRKLYKKINFKQMKRKNKKIQNIQKKHQKTNIFKREKT